jgi:hypothetical protein
MVVTGAGAAACCLVGRCRAAVLGALLPACVHSMPDLMLQGYSNITVYKVQQQEHQRRHSCNS